MEGSAKGEISCPNCLRKVPAENEATHLVYCQKNIKLCLECQEPMDINHSKAHRCKKYEPIQCKICQLKLGDRPLQDHLDKDCPERDIKCSYCSVCLPFKSLSGHQKKCAVRTSNCSSCNQMLNRCNMEIHRVVCPAREDVDEHLKELRKKTRPPPRKQTKGRSNEGIGRSQSSQEMEMSEMDMVMQQSLEEFYRKK